MATEIHESVVLNQEKWRVFELLKVLNHSQTSIRRIGSAQGLSGSGTKVLSHWQARYGGLEFNWKQAETFSKRDYSITFKMVEGDFERLEGHLELNGPNVGGETCLRLTLSIGWRPAHLDRQSRESLIRKSRFAVRKFLRQIQCDSDKDPLKHSLQQIGLEHLESFFGLPLPVQIRNDYREMRILTELDQQRITQVIDYSPPFLKVEKIIIAGDRTGDPCHSRSLATGRIGQDETAGHYNNSIFLALCGQLMASSTSIHLAALFPKTAPQVIEASGVKPVDLSSATKLLRPAKQGSVFFIDSQIIRRKLRLVSATTNIYFGDIHYGVIEDLKFLLAPASVLRSIAELPPA